MDRHAEAWAAVTPADVMRSVARRMPSVIVTTVLVTVIVALVLVCWPNRYSSDGLMYVRLGRGALSVDPAVQGANSISMQESRQPEVISIGEMIGSREIARRVVARVGVAEINRPRTWIDRLAKDVSLLMPTMGSASAGLSADEVEARFAEEDAIELVRGWVEIVVPKTGYTVSVSARGCDPILAQSLVQGMMDEYGQYHVEAHRAKGSLEFFEQQVSEGRKAALQAQQDLQAAKSEMGWMSVESGEETLRERIVKLEIGLDEAESGLAESETRVYSLKQQLSELDKWVPIETMSGLANNSGDNIRTKFYELEVEKSDAIARLSPKHPRYKMMQDKIDHNKEIVDQQSEKERVHTREAINPVYQDIETEYQIAIGRTAGLQSRQKSLIASMDEAKSDLKRLNSDAVTLARLNWQAEIAERNFLGHTKSFEEARVGSELDKQQMSDVSIVQPASLNLRKAGPPRLLLLLVGGLLGLCLGCLQALLRGIPAAAQVNGFASRKEEEAREKKHVDGADLVVGTKGKTATANLPR